MRILHTMVRIGNIDRSLKFYCDVLGMDHIRTSDHPEGKFTNVFIGYGNEANDAVLELTYNYGVEKYEIGTGYGHVAVEVPDAYKACADIKARGGKVTREAGPMKHGTTVIAFVEDPDGYKIELIQRKV